MIGIASEERLLNVAGYCRVSTDLDAQAESFETQTRYYTEYIRAHSDWRFVGIYTDYGISGTQRKHRTGFERMLRHCREGRIDRIVCKSISRFSRNVVDSLEVVQELKALGIGVTFEKEAIDTLSMSSEFILSTLAAISQEESRGISENQLWGVRKRFERGDVKWAKILGYDASKVDGKLVVTIEPAGANTVRGIYQLALEGVGVTDIARRLIAARVPTIRGDARWTTSLVRGILKNERYTGDVLCQKTYTTDYLTHKVSKNRGERPQYWVENHHPAIISKADFQAINGRRRGERGKTPSAKSVLAGRVFCGECGLSMRRYNLACARHKWGCANHELSARLCSGQKVYQIDIEKAVRQAFLEKYDIKCERDIYRLMAQLKHHHECDNVESERSILRNEIAAAVNDDHLGEDELLRSLRQKEQLWQWLEGDWALRTKCLSWLAELPAGSACLRAFIDGLNIERLRAWAIKITVLSTNTYSITWISGSATTTVLNEVECAYRRCAAMK